MITRILSFIILILLTDTLLYLVFLKVFANIFLRKTLRNTHLGFIILFVVFSIIIILITGNPGEDYHLYRNYFLWMDLFLLLYLPKLILLCTLAPLLLFRFGRRPGRINKSSHRIQLRYKYVWISAAFFLTLLTFFVTFDGMIRGTSHFKVEKVNLYYKDLPKGFDDFTIVQFSDIHLGSWFNEENVSKGLKMIQDLNADVIVFTGDLINVNADETKGYVEGFRSLSALGGKYAILGNHDMGDFARLNRGQNLMQQVPALTSFYKDQEFKLLRNSYAVIHKNNDSIIISGVDNWSSSIFKKYGDLNKALAGIKGNPFTVLLSHDPTHWRAEVLPNTKVDLTLSGHTHGGQMGFHFFGWHWSPIKYRYPEWDGLYEEAGRYLYVNPGMGFVGFSGRIGMLPEITLIQLHRQ